MRKLFILAFAAFISVSAFAREFKYINLDEKVLQNYNDLITTRHTAGDYAENYNTVWIKFDTYSLDFKNREELPPSDWRNWVNNGKQDAEIAAQIAACYPTDNRDIINELGANTNEYFNSLIAEVKTESDNTKNEVDCISLKQDSVRQAMIKIIRLQKIQRELRNFVYGDNTLNPLESSMSKGNKDEMGNGNFAVYLKLAEQINNLINTEAKVIENEIDEIWAQAMQEKKYVKKRNHDYIENLEMTKISKNWLIGTSSRLPAYLRDNPDKTLAGQSDRLLQEFKNLNVESSTMVKAKLETLDPVKKFNLNEEHIYFSKDLVLLYLPDNEIPAPVNDRWSVEIFVPVSNSNSIQKVFTDNGNTIDQVRVRGEVLELQKGASHAGSGIYLNNGQYKGYMIGHCVEWSYRGFGGKMVQLFTKENVKFIEDTISAVTPEKWPEIKEKIIFE